MAFDSIFDTGMYRPLVRPDEREYFQRAFVEVPKEMRKHFGENTTVLNDRRSFKTIFDTGCINRACARMRVSFSGRLCQKPDENAKHFSSKASESKGKDAFRLYTKKESLVARSTVEKEGGGCRSIRTPTNGQSQSTTRLESFPFFLYFLSICSVSDSFYVYAGRKIRPVYPECFCI